MTEAVAAGLEVVHVALARFWADAACRVPLPPASWRHAFDTALAEVAANSVRHAYPAATTKRPLLLRLRLYADYATARVVDRGDPWAPPMLAGAVVDDDVLALPESGYGLLIARAALDSLRYRRTRSGLNCWRLIKRIP